MQLWQLDHVLVHSLTGDLASKTPVNVSEYTGHKPHGKTFRERLLITVTVVGSSAWLHPCWYITRQFLVQIRRNNSTQFLDLSGCQQRVACNGWAL
jgi:hypothetical protein